MLNRTRHLLSLDTGPENYARQSISGVPQAFPAALRCYPLFKSQRLSVTGWDGMRVKGVIGWGDVNMKRVTWPGMT